MGVQVNVIGVLGAGQMGSGIAQTAAQSGYEVLLGDIDIKNSERGKNLIQKQLTKLVEKGKWTQEQMNQVLGKIKPTEGLESFKPCHLVIEAIVENPKIKFETFRKLDEVCEKNAILASNTSSISITSIAAATNRPEKVCGMHFMNPVPVMKLVEGIKGLQTSDETFAVARTVSEKMGKTFVEAQDSPGFVVNRILVPWVNEAVFALQEGLASPEDIDTAMKLGTNVPMGPLELADFVGIDTLLAICEVLYDGIGDPKFRPASLLRKYVEAGWHGRKTGRGFYRYD